MKKLLAFTLILVLVFGLIGCDRNNVEEKPLIDDATPTQANAGSTENVLERDTSLPEVPFAKVVSASVEIPIYVELSRDETGALYTSFYARLDEVKDQIPVITYQEDMSIVISEHFESWGTSAYDTEGNYIDSLGDLSELSELNGGEYYFRTYIVEKCASETQEYKGYSFVFRMTIPDLDPFLTVISGGKEIVAPKYWYCGMFWRESEFDAGWLFGDGSGIYENFEETCMKLPEVCMDKDFSLRYGENVTGGDKLRIHNENFEEIGWMESVQELLTLESGTYYVVANMFREDTEVHNGETGYDGYNCGFKLIIP